MESNNNIQKAVLKVLKYFNHFKFPLTILEIHKFIELKCDLDEIEQILNELLNVNKVFLYEGNYLIVDNFELVKRKQKGAKQAKKDIKKAKIIAKIISSFPFVRMVSISGSLSKNYSDEKSDIDFFILTSEHNLWTARTLLHILKKITFLVNMQHSFCMNYFLAVNKLTIEEQNYFTAIELATLKPIYNKYYYNKLVKANPWIKNYLPNITIETIETSEVKKTVLKTINEFVFQSKRLNTFFMNVTNNKWRKKWAKKGIIGNEYNLSFKTKKYVSKNHPDNHQKIVLAALNSEK